MPPLLASLPGIVKLAGRLRKPSERYGGKGGPLLGTVDSFLTDIGAGGARGQARLHQVWTEARKNPKWRLVWDNEVRGRAWPASIVAAAEALDPGFFVSASKSSGNGVAKAVSPKGGKAKASRAARAARAPATRARKVARYNPDTGRRTMVAEDSEEALTWSSRKPSAATRRLQSRVASSLSSGIVSAAARGARRITPAMAAKLARAGVAIGGLAAGYYVGTKLNTYLAGRALSKERAGVQAALAFREARAEAAAAKGAPLSPSELRSMGDIYKAQLRALGYDPVTFTRKRGVVERFFTGQEE